MITNDTVQSVIAYYELLLHYIIIDYNALYMWSS